MKHTKPIRVVVANHPKMMREAVMAAIADQPDVVILTEVAGESEMEKAIAETKPDVLIVSLQQFDQLPDVCYSILQNHPFLKILGIAPDRDSILFCWASLNIQTHRLESSRESILETLRRSG